MNLLVTGLQASKMCFRLFLVWGASAVSLSAQEVPGRRVVLAIPEAFPAIDARAIVVREGRTDVILLNGEDTSLETLDVALRVLRRLATQVPQRGRGVVVPITGFVPGGELRPERRIQLAGAIAKLQLRPVARVGSLGSGRWMSYRRQ